MRFLKEKKRRIPFIGIKNSQRGFINQLRLEIYLRYNDDVTSRKLHDF